MLDDFIDAGLVANSLLWILLQALIDEVFAFVRHRYAVFFGIREENWFRLY